MTVFNSIKNKNIDEFAEWLDENCSSDYAPWWKYWDENYCNKCEPIESTTKNYFGYTVEYAYCELNNNCRFFKDRENIPDNKQIIKMWLESELSNGDTETNDMVMCKDCKHIMYLDCYGECSQACKGIVRPNDSCEYGIRRDMEESK